MKKTSITLIFSIILSYSVFAQQREFTSSTGQKISASLLSVNNGSARLKKLDGSEVDIPLNRFSSADQEFIKKWHEENKGKVPAHLKDKMPRIHMVVTNGARADRDGDKESGFVHEQNKKLELKIAITNEDGVYPIPKANLTVMVWGEATQTGNNTIVYRKDFENFEMPYNQTKNYSTERFEVWWDDEGAKYGHEYKGYFVFVTDPEGKILGYKTMPGTAGKYINQIANFKAGETYSRKYLKTGTESISKTVRKVKR